MQMKAVNVKNFVENRIRSGVTNNATFWRVLPEYFLKRLNVGSAYLNIRISLPHHLNILYFI